MPFLTFVLEAALISLSGVMAPGPLTTLIVGKGNESPHAGAFVAFGHGIVEVPLMVAVLYGIGKLLGLASVKAAIGVIGGLFLLVMSVGMIRGAHSDSARVGTRSASPLVGGILLSIGNPYFLLWWATVGAAMVVRSTAFGLLGFSAFAVVHWMCDFVWSYFLSALSYRGSRFFGQRFQRVVSVLCGLLLLTFGAKFIVDGARVLLA